MDLTIPVGARAAARVLLFDAVGRLLLLEARDFTREHRWWLAPGGGVEAGETFEAAARRELYEETGLIVSMERWVWTRRHIFDFQGRRVDQYERFFTASVREPFFCTPVKADEYVVGHRWWRLDEVERSDAEFAPRRLALLLPAILRGEYPDPPIDCGV